jgi:hypothetical protein
MTSPAGIDELTKEFRRDVIDGPKAERLCC